MGTKMSERRSEVGGPFCPPSPLSSAALQCLKPEDVAEAVIYVLSTPPHVQVSLALTAHPLEEPSHPQRRTAGRP